MLKPRIAAAATTATSTGSTTAKIEGKRKYKQTDNNNVKPRMAAGMLFILHKFDFHFCWSSEVVFLEPFGCFTS